jgi:iron complex outermembrane receptor protein
LLSNNKIMKQLFLMLSMITLSAMAQDTTKSVKLTDIEVTGVRTNTNTPISQKTLSKEYITKYYQGQEMSYIIDKTPSITYQSDGGQPNGYTTFRMRGIDQTRVNMTLNGVPLNEPEDQGVYFSNYPNFATNLNSMQIQRGVGTSANGTASYGGSINFEGKTGVDKEASAQVGYGSFNTQRMNASYGSGINQKGFAFYTGLSAYQSDGYKYHSGGKGYSAFVSGGYYGGKNVIKFTAFTGHALNQMAWYAVSADDINKNSRTNYNPSGENDNFTQRFAQLQYVRSLNKNSTITTTAYYNRLDGLWGMFVDPTNPVDLVKYKLGSNFYGLMSNYHLQVNKLSLNVGVHANSYDRTHGGNLDSLKLYTNTGTKTEYSAYSKIGYTIGKFNLFGDIQVRNVSFSYIGDTSIAKLNWTFINPKGGITYNASNNTNYYFSVSQSHREPTRSDMFGGYDNLSTQAKANLYPFVSTSQQKIITPEQVIDYELGSNVNFRKFSAQYNLYYMDFKNEITLLGALGSNGLPLMTNVSKSYRSGVELDLKYCLDSHFAITNTSNYSYCRIKGDGYEYQPLLTPNLIVNQGVEYMYKGFTIGVQAKYHSKSYINSDNTLTTPEFVIINGNIGYTYKRYSLKFQGVNLTNTRYYTSGYGMGTDKYYFVNAPISGYLTLKMTL